jgi:PmbA protein
MISGGQLSISLYNEQVDRIHSSDDSSLDMNLFVDGRYGTYSTNRLEDAELRPFIERAVELTRSLEVDEARSLVDISRCYNGGGEDLSLFDDMIESVTPQHGIEIAKEVADEIINGGCEKLQSCECEFGLVSAQIQLLDSNGFSAETKESIYTISASCSLLDDDGSRPESFWYEGSIRFDDLKYKGCGEIALARGMRSLNPRRLAPGCYNIVLERSVSSRFVAPIMNALSGENLYQKSSFLRDSLDKMVFPEGLTIVDRPHLKGAMGARYFDSEGIATVDSSIIEKGVVSKYFIGSYYSHKMGIDMTINSPSVVMMEPYGIENGHSGESDILKKLGSGILITDFNGGNCNGTTGDFSYGIEGFLVKKGLIVKPISGMLMTGNMLELWSNLVDTSNDPLGYTTRKVPSLMFVDVVVN